MDHNKITPKLNKHMTHIEDLVMLEGLPGINWILKIFENLYKKFNGGSPEEKIRLSVKIDGAPAIFAWSSFPGLKAGIATKGLFAKSPKIMCSDKDIDMYNPEKPELAYKLKSFLKHFQKLNIPKGEIWQGDFLFDNKSLEEAKIDDKLHYAFHPNTIYYAVPKDAKIGKNISKSDIGIVWHTRYTGTDLESVSANYDASINELSPTPKVFMTDPYIKSIEEKTNIGGKESSEIETLLNTILQYSNILKNRNEDYYKIINNKDMTSLFSIFWNSLIKSQTTLSSPQIYIIEFVDFIRRRFIKEKDKRKTEKGKLNIQRKSADLIYFIENNNEIMEIAISVILKITELKEIFIANLNEMGIFKTFLKMKSGEMIKTGQEGFAISDTDGNVAKLIDRKEFSWSNFSPEVSKGWT